AFSNQTQRRSKTRLGLWWRLKSKGHEVVVQKRRSDANLRLFNCESSIMMPWHLLKCDKRKAVALSLFRISADGNVKLRNKIRREYFPRQRARLEGDMPAQDLRSVITGEPDRRDLTRQTIDI